jgi:hypothetical protein
VPGLVAARVPQLKLIAGTMVASASPAAVSWLYYANRLYELPLGVVSIASAAVLVPAIAASVREAAPEAIAAAQSRGYEIGLALALPSAVGFALLAEPIAGGLFERGAFGARDTAAVGAALAAICAGLPGHALEKVLGAVSFAHEDARRCWPRSPGWPLPWRARSRCSPATGTSAWRRPSPSRAGSAPRRSASFCSGAAGLRSTATRRGACRGSWRRPW